MESNQFIGKVYLDQKDYSRIAKGLSGDPTFKKDVEVYLWLVSLVNSNKLAVYYSWCHLAEALRYDDEKIQLLFPYCEVINNLTQGHCIIWPEALQKKELELCFAKHFRFESALSGKEYPYGKVNEAIALDMNRKNALDFREHLKNTLSEAIRKLPLSGKEKKYYLKHILKPSVLKGFLKTIPESYLTPLFEQFPGLEGKLTRDVLVDLYLSTPQKRAVILEDVMRNTFTFGNLVTHYSRCFPDLKKLGHWFDDSYEKISSVIKMGQMLFDMTGTTLSAETLHKGLVVKAIEILDDSISEQVSKFELPADEAREYLLTSELEHVPSIRSFIFFIVEYYKRHKSSSQRGRTPSESDIMDLNHLRNFPYVDFYVTDRFFAEVAKNGENVFHTKVFRNIIELQKYLQDKKSI